MGNILKVNLTTGAITTIPTSNYVGVPPNGVMGGAGLLARLYWDNIPAFGSTIAATNTTMNAFNPANCLIFAPGPLAGTGAHISTKCECTAMSPHMYPVQSYESANAQGGADLKEAGYDALVITGAASSPVYIWIEDGAVEIRPADDLWGHDTRYTRDTLWARHDPINPNNGSQVTAKTRVWAIGPAGENMSLACILADVNSAFGKGGYGAVMGSKYLKAIAFRGTKRVPIASPSQVMAVNAQRFLLDTIPVGTTRTVNGGTGAPKCTAGQHTITGVAWPVGCQPGSGSVTAATSYGMGSLAQTGAIRTRVHTCAGCIRQMCKWQVEFLNDWLPPGSAECEERGVWSSAQAQYYGDLSLDQYGWEANQVLDRLGLGYGSFGAGSGTTVWTNTYAHSNEYLGQWLYQGWLYGVFNNTNTGLPWTTTGQVSTASAPVIPNGYGSEAFMLALYNMIAYKTGPADKNGNTFGTILSWDLPKAAAYLTANPTIWPQPSVPVPTASNPNATEPVMQMLYESIGQRSNQTGVGFSHSNYPLPQQQIYNIMSDQHGQEPHNDWQYEQTLPKEVMEQWLGAGSSACWDQTLPTTSYYWGSGLATECNNHEIIRAVSDSLIACSFCVMSQPYTCDLSVSNATWSIGTGPNTGDALINSPNGAPEYLSAVFGDTVAWNDCLTVGSRTLNQIRCNWIRDGWTGPDAMYQTVYNWQASGYPYSGPGGATTVYPQAQFQNSIQQIYALRGWSTTGVPTLATLNSLGLSDVAKALNITS